MSRFNVVLLALLLTPVSLTAESQCAQPKSDFTNNPDTEVMFPASLRLATANDFEPYTFKDENDQWRGIDYEIVNGILEKANIAINLEALPRKRITLMLKQKTLDGVITTASYNSPDMLNNMWLSETLYSSHLSAYATQAVSPQLKDGSLQLQENDRIGVLEDFNFDTSALNLAAKQGMITVKRDRQLVDLLRVGRIDYAISEEISFVYSARKSKQFEAIKFVAEIESRDIRMALSQVILNRYPCLAEKMNQFIALAKENGSIDNIIYQYLQVH